MASPSPSLAPPPTSAARPPAEPGLLERITVVATSIQTVITILAAVAVLAFQKLTELQAWASTYMSSRAAWTVASTIAASPLLMGLAYASAAWRERRRVKLLNELTGETKPGYFRLGPRETDFARQDGKHLEILEWLDSSTGGPLYLTGPSGAGKSSILAWIRAQPGQRAMLIVRGYQDPVAVLTHRLRELWKSPPANLPAEPRALLERAVERTVKPAGGRLLVVFDQFEEFLIFHQGASQTPTRDFLAGLAARPVPGATLLLTLRTDYDSLVEELQLPPLRQGENWRSVPPFTQRAARQFLTESGLRFEERLLGQVLTEAEQTEETPGMIRPVVANLCGLVLARFANGLPRQYRSGGLLREFLRECVALDPLAPRLLRAMLSETGQRRRRTVTELAVELRAREAEVRTALRRLSAEDRSVMRPLDEAQANWEVSHDFIARHLDTILAGWHATLWMRARPWLPWALAAGVALATVGLRVDPSLALAELGWKIERADGGGLTLSISVKDPPFRESTPYMTQLDVRHLALGGCSDFQAPAYGESNP